MTFKRFEEIVKSKYPEAEVFSHGEFERGVRSKINVTVIFEPHGKCYHYNGTYCEVLNRLGIKAIYKHDLESCRATLEMYKRTNGTEGFFGNKIDNTESIANIEADISNFEKNYIIV